MRSTWEDFALGECTASMESAGRISWSAIVYQAVAAGIVGAVAIDAYLFLATILPSGGSIVAFWQFIASVLVGRAAAFASPSYAALGAATHVAVSICWAGGYAYFAATQPRTNRYWLPAGAAYGVVVYILMQLILLAGGRFQSPATPNAFVNVVVAHVVFFGIPVAYVVRALQSRG